MHFQLSCYQLKRDCYKIYYESLIVITKQNPIIGAQMIKRKIQSIPLKNISSQRKTTREEERNKETRKQSENNF